ncbi:hypothetical protein ONS95_005864 [Cadophora gregata]|uniref:uncharacterized protein n=1 Tax=Cadophora gregata TaxID=51156 RepID=UPI0026DD1106|nr:uncharacterized protein ONS95_005864 [Cadophora gregata]KAK0102241.1 hypothetical protein ONS95_005864 [Cadophora gregata]
MKIRINDHIPIWIRNFRDNEETPYLNRHAPAKEKPGARPKRQRFRKTWCYSASQSSPPPTPHNSLTLLLPVAKAPSLLESTQSHRNVPPYQTAPHFSQAVSSVTHSHDNQNRPDDVEIER